MKTIEAASGKWFGILRHFGVDESFLKNKHGPCPMCGGKDRFRWDDKDGSGSYICSHCGAGDGFALVLAITGREFKDVANEIDKIVSNIQPAKNAPEKEKPDPRIRLNEIQRGLQPIDSINPVRLYLQSRGLKPTKEIRYHRGLVYYEDGIQVDCPPAMVCRFDSVKGEGVSYHVTYLRRSGKVRKVMPPVIPLAGSAIRLTGIYPHIGIAEGIETALAVMRDFRVPCWAAGNATLLESFNPPSGIDRVTVFGDNDANYTGQKAAYTLARRLADRMRVDVHIPDTVGADFADCKNQGEEGMPA